MAVSRLRQVQEVLLEAQRPLSATAIAARLEISQPTLSRALSQSGDRIVRIGRARATRYSLARDIARAGSRWPLYRITAEGRPESLGEMRALHGGGFHFESSRTQPTFLHGEFASGLYPGLPWFLDDQRPQGFLGRTFARRVAADLNVPEDLQRWQPDDVVLALLRYGDDAPGDLVLGETALQQAMRNALDPPDAIDRSARSLRYPALADAVLRGEAAGSSAGGEQPKFTVILRESLGFRSAIVKFSDRNDSPGGQRWSDLLHCEHIATAVLREHGQSAAESEIVHADGRTFLQSTRFDRTPVLGRSGYVSLAAFDAAFYGHASIDWWRLAETLRRDAWLTPEHARGLSVIGLFGALIGNTDMHLGNAGLVLADAPPLALAPAYDMLPMRFRPAASGEVVERDLEVILPTPQYHEDWRTAAAIAGDFWRRAGIDSRLSPGFRELADRAGEKLERAVARHG